jgi:hypothetical protein
MVAWSEELAGYTPEELKRGLAACKNRNFPVSFPEFVNLCRPVLTPEEALSGVNGSELSQGHDRLVRRALAHCGTVI